MAQFLTEATLVMLILAALVFAFQALRQRQAGQLSTFSFPTVLLVVLVGWMVTEAASDVAGPVLGQVGGFIHLAVMVLFAATITLQFKRSLKAGSR